jgi:hypothetical protein
MVLDERFVGHDFRLSTDSEYKKAALGQLFYCVLLRNWITMHGTVGQEKTRHQAGFFKSAF